MAAGFQHEPSSTRALSYALVTPARNEADNLPRLAACVAAQTVQPARWVIVENGSTDGTAAVAAELAAADDRIEVLSLSGDAAPGRGGAIVRAFAAGLARLGSFPDVVVNVDADVSLEPDYFERLLGRFAASPTLGIASGSGWEFVDGRWRQQFLTRSCVWGATRAYRRECLAGLTLEERYGWDGLDDLQARLHGWTTETLLDLPFRHHRSVGARDGARHEAWTAEGRLAHYMGYRPGYLLVRALFRVARERSAAPLAMVPSYVRATVRREPRWADERARASLRGEQRLRRLPVRALEAIGRRT